jgi:hypothetical protein
MGFHVFRHTCASLLFEAGHNIKQIQEWLGHWDPAYTLATYVHLTEHGLGDAEFFDELLLLRGNSSSPVLGPVAASAAATREGSVRCRPRSTASGPTFPPDR